MKNNGFALTLVLSVLTGIALAQTPASPKAQYTADSKVAMTRYDGDKKLCNDETSSTARLQCRASGPSRRGPGNALEAFALRPERQQGANRNRDRS